MNPALLAEARDVLDGRVLAGVQAVSHAVFHWLNLHALVVATANLGI